MTVSLVESRKMWTRTRSDLTLADTEKRSSSVRDRWAEVIGSLRYLFFVERKVFFSHLYLENCLTSSHLPTHPTYFAPYSCALYAHAASPGQRREETEAARKVTSLQLGRQSQNSRSYHLEALLARTIFLGFLRYN